jgi:3-methyl-2-oxobutanoate hydroxymethyltransferase
MNIFDFKKMKEKKEKISMVTCYDYWSAKIIQKSNIDCVLVGDSLSMVVYGEPNTVNVSVECMAQHVQAVSRALQNKFLVADMPFLSYRKSHSESMNAVEKLMKAGANAVKLEGAAGNIDLISYLVESGVPVMGHLGLTPQFVHQMGGFKVQGKSNESAQKIFEQAKQLEKAGCFSIVLEAVPEILAKNISKSISVPTIGIGAGLETDGQVLVLQDMLGMDNDFQPKFLKKYLNGQDLILNAMNDYDKEVKEQEFPDKKQSYEHDLSGELYGH